MKMFLPLSCFLINIACLTAKAASNQDLIYLGSCSWGNTSIASCTHASNNALASFYLQPTDGQILVFNRIAAENLDMCVSPSSIPEFADLTFASGDENGLTWTDAGSTRNSGLTFVGSILNEMQAGTNAFNWVQHIAGRPQRAYPTCYLVKAP